MKMNKFKNYIFLTICEVSVELFEKTEFQTYANYCRMMNMSLKDNNLSRREKSDLIIISERVDKIFSLGKKLTAEYIVSYFDSGRHLDFERSVRLTKEFFPITGD